MDKRTQVISIFFSVFFIIAVLGVIALESANLTSSGDISRISNSFTLTDNAYQSLISAYQSSNSLGLSPAAAAILEDTIAEISNSYFINYHLNLSLESGLSSPASSLTGQPFVEKIPLTIDNTQNAGESTFQQMINITSSDPGWSYISKNPFGQNVEFLYPNGQVIPSWLQNDTSNSGVWWIKLGSLPADSTIKIYMAFAPTNVNLFNGNTIGEAPTLSVYGEYDNGANVFNDYWNFEGTSIPSVFTVINPSGVTVNNGIYIAPQPNNYAGIQYNGVFSPNSVVEYDELNSYSVNGCWAVGEAVGSFNSSGGYIYVYNQGGSAPSPIGWSGGSIVISNGIAYNSIFNSVPRNDIIIGEAWPRENLQVYYAGNQVADESSTSQTLINSGISFSFGGYYCTNGSSISAAWIRIRTYPPNGVMPSVTFG